MTFFFKNCIRNQCSQAISKTVKRQNIENLYSKARKKMVYFNLDAKEVAYGGDLAQ